MSSLKDEFEAIGAIRAGYEQAKALELLLKRCVWMRESVKVYVSSDMPDCEYAWTGAHMCVCARARACMRV